MKRLILILAASFSLLLCALPVTAVAVDILDPVCNSTSGKTPTACKENQSGATENPIFGPNGIMTTIVKWLARIVGLVSFIVIVVAGVTLAGSGGDSNKATESRRAITFAAIGIVVALFAQAIVSFVLNKL